MYADALRVLSCPQHPETVLQLIEASVYDADSALHTGVLQCASCGARYGVREGIADLLGSYVPTSPAQFTNVLPVTAWGYERIWRPRALTVLAGEDFGYERELPLIVEMLAPQRGGLYIDIACSNGLYARALGQAVGERGGAVIGIDHALPMLQEARASARRAGFAISYVRASAQALPFSHAAAAGVAMGGSLNEIGDAPQALREMRRVLAADGRGALMNLVRSASTAGAALQSLFALGGIDFWPLPMLNEALAQAGFRVVRQEQHGVVVLSQLAPL
jgi:ubiquinone/menaquinone biosynthesis C-methylase UbiE/uncharacterized protein YbaR (Trm112 family)